MKDEPLTDEELVALFRGPAGDGPSDEEAAWSCFLAEFEGRIRYTCRFWMNRYGRPDEAEDRFQDVIVLLSKDNYRPIRDFAVGRAKMSTWVTAIATNACRGWFRSRDRTVFAPEPVGQPAPEAKDPDAIDPLGLLADDESGRLTIKALSHCVRDLDPKRQLVFVTRLLCQLAFERRVTMSEVGRIHGDSPQTTKYRLDTTLEQLRE
jgi:RNA polymerase sigma factor (sigma-70 family)